MKKFQNESKYEIESMKKISENNYISQRYKIHKLENKINN